MPTRSPLPRAAQSTKQPLILSGHAHDVHAAAVCWALRRSGYRPTWAQTLADATMAPVSLHADDRGGLRFSLAVSTPAQTSSVSFVGRVCLTLSTTYPPRSDVRAR